MSSELADVIFEKKLIEMRNERPFQYKVVPHKKSDRDKHPKLWLVFDTEAHIEQITEEVQRQTLAFGFAIYNRHYKDGHNFTSDMQFFENGREFALLLEHVIKQGSKLYVLGHNVGYDWVITNINEELVKLGWEMKFFSDSKGATIIPYRRKGKEIIFIDSMNFFRSSLETIANEFGLEKIAVDFTEDDTEKLMLHCKRDVEILDKVMKAWFNLLHREGYGSFKPTIASQALEAFKQKFLTVEIDTSQGKVQKDKERLCYYGGRTEANFIGLMEQNITCLDINAAYPSVMVENVFPIKYIKTVKNPEVDYVQKLPSNIGGFAEVTINTELALYPVKRKDRLIFPTGRYNTWLAFPELQHAIRKGYCVSIKTLHLYHVFPLFKEFILQNYSKRQIASENGNTSLALMYKLLMNALYGKFGESRKVWTPIYQTDNPNNGYETVINLDTNKIEKHIIFNGVEHHLIQSSHKSHAFPLISAYVTSYLRVKMIEAIEKVGRFNWIYCDTDSIYVTDLGLERMKDSIHPDKLGAWKIEKVGESIQVRGLKDYTFENETKIKGIPSSATKMSDNEYKFVLFTTLHYHIEHGEMGVVYTYHTTKELERSYKKGVVSAQGWVTPYHLEEFT